MSIAGSASGIATPLLRPVPRSAQWLARSEIRRERSGVATQERGPDASFSIEREQLRTARLANDLTTLQRRALRTHLRERDGDDRYANDDGGDQRTPDRAAEQGNDRGIGHLVAGW